MLLVLRHPVCELLSFKQIKQNPVFGILGLNWFLSDLCSHDLNFRELEELQEVFAVLGIYPQPISNSMGRGSLMCENVQAP